jgi:hypothetical protein
VIHIIYKSPVAANKKNNVAREAGLNSRDILRFYKELKAKSPNRIAIFCDNGGYQSSPEITAWSEESGVPIIHNVKYRPDCNGIEEIWGWAKKLYRPLVLYHKAMNLDWDQIEVVTKIMEQVPQETASKYVQRGWTALRNAEPIALEDDSILKGRGFNTE